jgi:DNA-binding MarR family transcriptional regulator
MYDARPLTAALGFPIHFPKAPITRSIRMLFKDRASLEPYQEKRKYPHIRRLSVKDDLNESQRAILKLVTKVGDVTGASAAEATRWTRNHCAMILASLHKKGLVKRRKAKGNHTRWYIYYKGDEK